MPLALHMLAMARIIPGCGSRRLSIVIRNSCTSTTSRSVSGLWDRKSTSLPVGLATSSSLTRNFLHTTFPNHEEDEGIYGTGNLGMEHIAVPRVFKGNESDFPCLLTNVRSGPEPEYDQVVSGFKTCTTTEPFYMKYSGGILPELTVAYETWGKLNEEGTNTVLICSGLSGSSHAKSHEDNLKPGWWEKFIGPGCAIDTNKFYVICSNNLGGCYGTSGPSTINPVTRKPYGTTFPIMCLEDLVKAQFVLLDHLGIEKLHGVVGASLGGMTSIMSGVLFPDRVNHVVTISSCAKSHPTSIAMRYLQRRTIMSDPNWNYGHYYDKDYPKVGMKLAREIATITYRSGPEWDLRFGRERIDSSEPPSLCPNFVIESYLDYQGEKFCTKFDPNSLLYISKAMDLFDVSEDYGSLTEGLGRITCPVLVLGVQTDILFPIWQQRQLAKALQDAGNKWVTYYELNSIFGHDTFLLDLNGVGAAIKGFLESGKVTCDNPGK